MSDDIRTLSAELAADPSSLVFLRLGEALRQRGQLEAAAKVVLAGLTRYPHHPAAHALYAHVLADGGDYERAFDEWDMALRLDPTNGGALKGIGYLYYRAGDHTRALEHLAAASSAMPEDEGLQAAIARLLSLVGPVVAQAAPADAGPAEPAVDPSRGPFADLDESDGARLLVDSGGLCIGGRLTAPGGADRSEAVAAEMAGACREASRAADHLDLGAWQSVIVECVEVNLLLERPTPETFLLVMQDSEQPIGQLRYAAERAAASARRWLEAVR
jgi:predicted regulator of Ras-like GTPase activity (Roadblock/LC7/MglB family)